MREHTTTWQTTLEDKRIIELYWDRDETAIQETDNKYGKFLFKIAHINCNTTN